MRSSLVAILLSLLAPAVASACSESLANEASSAPRRVQLGGLQVPFVANEGQVDPRVAYYVPAPGAGFSVTRAGELVYALREGTRPTAGGRRRPSRESARGWSLTEVLVGGRPHPAGRDLGPVRVGDVRGSDPARWRPALPTYRAVDLGEVWPGVTVALQARGSQVEKIFTVEPGGPVEAIRVRVNGAEALTLGAGGALVARTGLGDVTFTPPVAYQDRGGVRRPVDVAYRIEGREYGFRVGAHDPALPLVIDPLLQSTFLGGSDIDRVDAMAIHPTTGHVYVTGMTSSQAFPGTSGGFFADTNDAWVARLDATLTTLLGATYFGGTGNDFAVAVVLYPDTGHLFVAGQTSSDDLPTTPAVAQPALNGFTDAFVAQFAADLTFVRTTYLGGSGQDEVRAIGIQRNPSTDQLEVYVAGETQSADLPAAGNALDGTSGVDAFVARLSIDLATVLRSRYVGGTKEDGATALGFHPTTGAVYVAGGTLSTDFPGTSGGAQPLPGAGTSGDAFVAKLDSNLATLQQSSYLGGGGDDFATALLVHPTTGDVYVAGGAQAGLPGTALGAQTAVGGLDDAFVARLNADLTPVEFRATYLGGNGFDTARGLALHPVTGQLYVTGNTSSTNFPSTLGGAQVLFGGGDADMFISRLSADLASLFQSTYLGRATEDEVSTIAISALNGDVYVAGATGGAFPRTTGGAQQIFGGPFSDGVVARLTRELDAPPFDLTIAKSHAGNFFRGQVGATYTITVTNSGSQDTSGTVTVTDLVPAGLTPTALAGPNWACTLGTRTCTRSDALAAAASYPAITLTVDVAADAPASVTNTATVAGGGDTNDDNNTASDPTTIEIGADLRIAKTHVGNFVRGRTGAVYTISVSNTGTAGTDGTLVTVTDTLPGALTAVSIAGDGWGCSLAGLTCTRSGVLAPGSSYPVITLTVDVAADALGLVTNTATVSGPIDADPSNNTAEDPTLIVPGDPNLTVLKSHVGIFLPGQVGATYTITVVNVGVGPTDGTEITVVDALPAGLTATALAGQGWTCVVPTVRCSRTDAVGAGGSYPPITLTVRVDAQASAPVVNSVTVSGGGDVSPGNNTANDPTSFGTIPFVDVPANHPFFPWVDALVAAEITRGCATTPPSFCPDAIVTRGELAVLMLRAIHGGAYGPPPATGTDFDDVPISLPLAAWIEQFFAEGMTRGCSTNPPLYCPAEDVTRREVAIFLVRFGFGEEGLPAATGRFTDVPVDHPSAPHIEKLATEGVTTGCGPTRFCPDAPVTRGQFAVFLARLLGLAP